MTPLLHNLPFHGDDLEHRFEVVFPALADLVAFEIAIDALRRAAAATDRKQSAFGANAVFHGIKRKHAYKIGMLKILELREHAEATLGDKFDLNDFHTVILSNGSMPFDVLEDVVQNYIDEQ